MTQVMLADRGLEEHLRDRIGVVHSAGVTMRALVDDILDVAKMETGNLTIEHVPFDLKGMLRDVSRLWEEQARGKGLDFVLDLQS
ncbi:sensor histidine kinase, partial [Clostridium perfringens]